MQGQKCIVFFGKKKQCEASLTKSFEELLEYHKCSQKAKFL